MKRALRFVALAILAGAGAVWLVTGADRGWTKTSVPVTTLDEVTGLQGITYKKQFVAGVDFLGAAALGAGVLAGVSFLFRNQSQSKP